MTEENLKKSIIFIGPSCVGKTFISPMIAEKLNYKLISTDELLTFVESEIYDGLRPDDESCERHAKLIKEDYKNNPRKRKIEGNAELEAKQDELIKLFLERYRFYDELLGGLDCFKSDLLKFKRFGDSGLSDLEFLVAYAHTVDKVIKTIIEKLDEPVVFDLPVCYGWDKIPKSMISMGTRLKFLRSSLHISFYEDASDKDSLTRYKNYDECPTALMQKVLLVPGEDYNQRNGASRDSYNDLVLKNLDSYVDTDLMISTNGLFSDPTNLALRNRGWFDSWAYVEKERLHNKGTTASVCDQIIMGLQELSEEDLTPEAQPE